MTDQDKIEKAREALKPCPFCGDECAINYVFCQSDGIKEYGVNCIVCSGRKDGFPTEKSALIAWNTRAAHVSGGEEQAALDAQPEYWEDAIMNRQQLALNERAITDIMRVDGYCLHILEWLATRHRLAVDKDQAMMQISVEELGKIIDVIKTYRSNKDTIRKALQSRPEADKKTSKAIKDLEFAATGMNCGTKTTPDVEVVTVKEFDAKLNCGTESYFANEIRRIFPNGLKIVAGKASKDV